MTNASRPRAAVFAIPGDIATKTGGFIYERRLLEALRADGRRVEHLQLPAGFPSPSAGEMAETVAALRAVPADMPIILDGLVFGAIDTLGLASVAAPICAMLHHPLGLETGLSADRVAYLLRREAENLRIARHVLVPSGHTAEVLVRDFGVPREKISVAPPGFDPVTEPRRPITPPLILSVGILHPRKGHDTLIEALSLITDLDWQATIVGPDYDPAHADVLRRLLETQGLQERVRLAGSLDYPELQAHYGGATLFALATRYEGYGMVFGEALRHGLPIVSCRAGAVPDTVPADAGLLVPPDDPVAFAEALRRLLADDGLREGMSRAAGQAGSRLPDWSEAARIAGRVLDDLA